MSQSPLVSVVIPAYNAEDSILRAVKSLKKQSYKNWECIIVDDGSTDSTYEIVSGLNDKRLMVFRFNENKGRAVARQFALDKAKGDYLAMLDADDWIYPSKLEEQLKIMENDCNICLVSSMVAVSDKEDNLVGVSKFPKNYKANKKNPPLSGVKVPVKHASSLIKMEIAKKCAYKYYLNRSQDSDFLRQILYQGSWLITDEITYVYRDAGNSTLSEEIKSYFFSIVSVAHNFLKFPFSTVKEISLSTAKILIHLFFGVIGKLENLHAQTRWREPQKVERKKYRCIFKNLIQV